MLVLQCLEVGRVDLENRGISTPARTDRNNASSWTSLIKKCFSTNILSRQEEGKALCSFPMVRKLLDPVHA